MIPLRMRSVLALLVGATLLSGCQHTPKSSFQPLFPQDGVPQGWVVTEWSDLSKPAPAEAKWEVKDGVLHGSNQRGTWLVSQQQYGDFILDYEFKLGERGNSGCALRAPLAGDPAFDGLELQMADFRYNTEAKDSELTGGLYRALAPRKQVYRPTEWNHYRITLRGSHIHVVLNGEVILDHDLSRETATVTRHDGSGAVALKDRPLRGHIGFQELSRGGDHVLIRNAKLKVLD